MDYAHYTEREAVADPVMRLVVSCT